MDIICPGCGSVPVLYFGEGQAFCGNDECKIIAWDPKKTMDELLEDVQFLDLEIGEIDT